MATGELVLSLATFFCRATELARCASVSRMLYRGCSEIITAATRVEAVLCPTSDVDAMVEDASSALRVQSQPGGVLILYIGTNITRSKAIPTLLDELVRRGVLPSRKIPTFVSLVFGLLGRTAKGYPLELEEGSGVLIVVFPKAVATLISYQDLEPEDVLGQRTAECLILNGERDLDSIETSGLPGCFFGGITKKRTGELLPDGQLEEAKALGIRFTGRGAHSVTMAGVVQGQSTKRELRQPVAADLVKIQRDEVHGTLLPEGARREDWQPQAIMAFACNGRGGNWYAEPDVEAKILSESYGQTSSSHGSPQDHWPPALFGMFCGGELGPEVARALQDSSEEEDEEEPAASEGELPARKDAAAHVVPVPGAGFRATARASTVPLVERSRVMGFTTIVAVVA